MQDDKSSHCDLSVMLVSYNTRDITLNALKSFYDHSPQLEYEVIVVDNASSDGSADAIERNFPQAKLFRLDENLGFGAANNYAARFARGRRLLLLNPDTVHLDDATGAVWRFAERSPQRGIWGGRTLFADRKLNPTSCWGDITLWSLFCSATGLTSAFRGSSLFNPEGYGSWRRDADRSVDIVTGCFLLIDTDLWRKLEGFDPTFFMYAEETDLCLRARRLGARPAITPDATLIHYGGASEVSGVERIIKVMRGRSTLIRKHWSPPAVLVGSVLLRVWALVRLTHARLRGSDKDKWRTIWRRRAEWIAGY